MKISQGRKKMREITHRSCENIHLGTMMENISPSRRVRPTQDAEPDQANETFTMESFFGRCDIMSGRGDLEL